MSAMILFITVPLFFLLHLIYLQIGSNLKIYARKQDQSRRGLIVTGAGIVFSLAWLVFFSLNEFVWPVFMTVLLMATIMGLIDDVWEVPIFIQIIVHGFLFFLIINDLGIIKAYPMYVLMLCIIFSLGFLLVVSKHDGSNGLLLSTTLLFFLTLPFVLPQTKIFDQTNPVIYIIFALLSFGWFNFREKAQLFMGAAGRIALSYLILFFMFQLVFGLPLNGIGMETVDSVKPVFKPVYLLFFAVMAIDFLQALILNIISGKSYAQLPLGYVVLKEKNLSFYSIILIYTAPQLVLNIFIIYFD